MLLNLIKSRAPSYYQATAHTIKLNSRSFHRSTINLGLIKPFLLADIGEGITECEIVQWFVEPGATVQEFDKICEVQSDKASVEISSRYAGNVVKLYYGKHDVAKVGYPLVDIETDEEDFSDASPPPVSASSPSAVAGSADTTASSSSLASNYKTNWVTPAVRRLLNEYDIQIKDVSGSGKSGMLLKGDVLKHIKLDALQKVEKRAPTETNQAVKSTEELGQTVKLTAIQKAMFKTMTKSLSIPQLGYKDEIELNATSEYREALNKYISSQPDRFPFKKISYLPILIKSLSLSLSYFPLLNAYIEESDNGKSTQLVYREAHNIGVAMDTPQGLIVPNIKNVEQKTIFQVASEIHRLTELAKKGAIPLADLKGGTISLSNIGSIGGTYANPIIVSNELAIVALGSARRLPRFDEASQQFVAKQILPVSWSADHRIIDGATIAQFGNTWKSFIENPALLASKMH
ncbi:2-oxoacid dehydrogenase acyltransferase [Mucor ambiguus]|uniref:Dihydrolipoamide acetyltransferase component of pyruvate dehydrogenase complex n=1 Tax=Mucor ambiguus TaxID=91626 RepID=A0A0C9MTH8_9FUNG|nr:2-oxoacid dehydrogenase acyltransferase [Mucor ambiguus]